MKLNTWTDGRYLAEDGTVYYNPHVFHPAAPALLWLVVKDDEVAREGEYNGKAGSAYTTENGGGVDRRLEAWAYRDREDPADFAEAERVDRDDERTYQSRSEAYDLLVRMTDALEASVDPAGPFGRSAAFVEVPV